MIEWLQQSWSGLSWGNIVLAAVMFALSLVVSMAAIGIVMVKLPVHYFSSNYEQDFLPGSPWLVRWGATIAKNVAGILLILIGIVLSLPGVPGQGVLTILLGLIFLDVPGKRPLEARIIKKPAILRTVNKFREKYHRPPFELD